MSFVGRQDRVLLAGLAIALIVVFAKPIRYLLDLARDVEQTSGLALVPALVILTIVFLYHLQGRRQEAREQAAAAQAGALQAEWRATELERLVMFGQALGRSLDIDTIRDVVLQQLPKLAGSDDAWVMTREDGHWKTLVGGGQDVRRQTQDAREDVANRTLGADRSHVAPDPVTIEGYLCTPLTAGGYAVGFL